jgi:hypothetical protein
VALDALAADSVLMSALGPLRSTAYLAVKRSEEKHFAERLIPAENSIEDPESYGPPLHSVEASERGWVPDVAYECRQHWLKF